MIDKPSIYLSPSTQEFNPYIIGGSEEAYMNKIADAMVPYLDASGIAYTRNSPDMTAASSIRQANSGYYDFYIAIHSNAAPPSKPGTARGTEIYYYPSSYSGKKMAQIMMKNFKTISPVPSLVKIVPTVTLGEVSKTKAPSVLIEIAYHDNTADALWISENIEEVARVIVKSICEYFGIPFVEA